MTNKEKIEELDCYCANTICNDYCVLCNRGWEHEDKTGNKCLNFMTATTEELDKALKIIGYKAPEDETPIGKNKYERHMDICHGLNDLYHAKNTAYGDAFAKSFTEYGAIMAAIRLEDKLNRIKALIKNPQTDAGDESIVDTLRDLANYAIMTIIEMEN